MSFTALDENIVPEDPCHKCGEFKWARGVEPLAWSCVYCGNIAYLSYGSVVQQIDVVMAARKGDYVHTPDGTAIIPKAGEDVKLLRLKQKLNL